VCQPGHYAVDNGVGRLKRFKWGMYALSLCPVTLTNASLSGRIVMETPRPPMIIPMWITGFDRVMPEGRRFPFKYMPRFGAPLSVTFGDPIPPENIIGALQHRTVLPANTSGTASSWVSQPNRPSTVKRELGNDEESEDIRIEITEVVQRAVEELGRNVSGQTLGGKVAEQP
jgi:monolysocardiolipin acyltransferase